MRTKSVTPCSIRLIFQRAFHGVGDVGEFRWIVKRQIILIFRTMWFEMKLILANMKSNEVGGWQKEWTIEWNAISTLTSLAVTGFRGVAYHPFSRKIFSRLLPTGDKQTQACPIRLNSLRDSQPMLRFMYRGEPMPFSDGFENGSIMAVNCECDCHNLIFYSMRHWNCLHNEGIVCFIE